MFPRDCPSHLHVEDSHWGITYSRFPVVLGALGAGFLVSRLLLEFQVAVPLPFGRFVPLLLFAALGVALAVWRPLGVTPERALLSRVRYRLTPATTIYTPAPEPLGEPAPAAGPQEESEW